MELLAGSLLLTRAYRIGALISLAMMANITVIDFVYDIGPVKWWALGLCVASSLIIISEIEVYQRAFRCLAKP